MKKSQTTSSVMINWIRFAKAGEVFAFEELIKMFQSPIRGYLRRLCNYNHEIADELAQETFVKLYNNIHQLEKDEQFKSWLFGIAYREFLQYLRKQKIEPTQEFQEEDFATQDQSDDNLDALAALKVLGQDEKEVILLHYQEGMTHTEIAEITDKPIGIIKSLIKRGKEKMVKLFKEEESV